MSELSFCHKCPFFSIQFEHSRRDGDVYVWPERMCPEMAHIALMSMWTDIVSNQADSPVSEPGEDLSNFDVFQQAVNEVDDGYLFKAEECADYLQDESILMVSLDDVKTVKKDTLVTDLANAQKEAADNLE